MIPMRHVLLALVLIGALAAAETTPGEIRVAKVDIEGLHDELREVILAKPENAALKKADEEFTALDEKRNKAAQQASRAGKDPQEALKDLAEPDGQVRQKVDRLIKTEILRFVVKKYGNRFTVVLDSSQATDAIIYLDGEIVDVTQAIRQSLQLNTF
jgi:hypothetical protein